MDTEHRDDKGRFTDGNPGGPGRPVFSIVSIIKAKLQSVPRGQHRSVAEAMISDYIADAREHNDGVAIRDIIDRFDGKPKQHVAVSDDRQEAWRDLQREAFVQPDTEEDMESVPESGDEPEATDT